MCDCCPQGAVPENRAHDRSRLNNSTGNFMQGKLNIGEPISIPSSGTEKKRIKEEIPIILTASPGAPVLWFQSIEGCDYCILVTEPTPFGLHDLKISVQVVKKMGIPFGIVIKQGSK
jgi:MinD superfamily P-loop ATPase